jgi:hypothetical protein
MPQTGPTTPEGKLIVSRNRIRHGLRTQAIVIPDLELVDDWTEFESEVVDALDPQGSVECELAGRVAQTLWRLRRVPRAEQEAVVEEHARIRRVEEGRADCYAQLPETNFYRQSFAPRPLPPMPILPPEKALESIARYEAHLNRQLYQALHELEAARDRRAGRPSPLGRIDLNAAEP